jgi:fructose-1,6-bisphosphatase I
MIHLKDFIKSQKDLPLPAGDALKLLEAISKASKTISLNVNRAGLIDIIGAAGAENVQGEEQQKLDVYADNEVMNCFEETGLVAAAASEENEYIVVLNDDKNGKYVVSFDPLDGSSNIDVNVSIGTIFNVFKRKSEVGHVSEKDFMRKGREQLMAGYVIYGSSTMLVFTTGNGVNGFTLDPESKKYALSHPNIQTPESGRIYSINEGNAHSFDRGLTEYIDYCKSKENDKGKAYSGRYIGSMVADIHRNLIKGGIFIYPATASAPEGKLRLLYECQPMAYIYEQAGGIATSGAERIMDIPLKSLHQRSPVYMGSSKMIKEVMKKIAQNVNA